MRQIYFLFGILIFFSCAEDEDNWKFELKLLQKEKAKILAYAMDYPCTDPSDWGIYEASMCLSIPYYKPLVDINKFADRYNRIQYRIARHYQKRKRNVAIGGESCDEPWSPPRVICDNGQAKIVYY